MSKMKFVYWGTPYFSARTLEKLLDAGLIPAAVVTNPDRPAGRKKIMTAPPVKTLVENRRKEIGEKRKEEEIQILQPEKLDAQFIEKITSLAPDFFVVFAYNKIFRKNVLDIPRLGTIGVHPSFLPKYRGPSPFQTALLNGETETGVTLYLLDEGVDSGPILAKSPAIAITEKDTFESLAGKLADAGAQALIETLPKFIAGEITPQPQDESQATFTKKFKTEDGFVAPEELAAAMGTIDFMKSMVPMAPALDRKIRALNPDPGVWTTASDGKRLKLLEAEIQNGTLKLTKTQKEGERPKAILIEELRARKSPF